MEHDSIPRTQLCSHNPKTRLVGPNESLEPREPDVNCFQANYCEFHELVHEARFADERQHRLSGISEIAFAPVPRVHCTLCAVHIATKEAFRGDFSGAECECV